MWVLGQGVRGAADLLVMRLFSRGETVRRGGRQLRLDRRRSSRIGAGVSAGLLFAAAAGWLTFCLTVSPGPDAWRGAQTVIRLMSLFALPMVVYAVRFSFDALGSGEIVVRTDRLVLRLPHTLRQSIELAREDVAGAIVDVEGTRSGDERLRFPVAGGGYLYSSIVGSALRYLGQGPGVPNLAIVLRAPMAFLEPRRIRVGASEYEPVRPLQPDVPVVGVLVRVSDAEKMVPY